jgi:hypothetical protein
MPKIDDNLSNANPNRLPGSMEITTLDGVTTLFEGEGHVEGGLALQQAVHEKFLANTVRLNAKRIGEIVALAGAVETQKDLAPLMLLLLS